MMESKCSGSISRLSEGSSSFWSVRSIKNIKTLTNKSRKLYLTRQWSRTSAPHLPAYLSNTGLMAQDSAHTRPQPDWKRGSAWSVSMHERRVQEYQTFPENRSFLRTRSCLVPLVKGASKLREGSRLSPGSKGQRCQIFRGSVIGDRAFWVRGAYRHMS